MPKTTTVKTPTKFDLKTEATRTLYAGAGVADLATEVVRDYVAEVTKKLADVQKTVADFDFEPKSLRDQATVVVASRVEALADDAKARREAIEARVAELQADALALPGKVQALIDDTTATATDTYVDLAKRGQVLVGRIRGQESTKKATAEAKTTTAKAKTVATQATKTATATKTAAKKTTKSTVSAAKKSATTNSAPARKKATTTKSSVKSTATAAKKTATAGAQATTAAAKKVGD